MEMAKITLGAAGLLLSLLLALPPLVWGHCDTLDGPVVVDARTALAKGDVTPVLKWVPAAGEHEVREAFGKALAVRGAGKEAQDLADTWFFETLVRVHRAGEGAPYTGLKPAGLALTPGLVAADAAVAKGEGAAVEKLLVEAVRHGLHERFAQVKSQRPPGADVAAGRAWVAAYVPFVHWVEAVEAAAAGGGAHGEGREEAHAQPTPGDHAEPAHAGHAEPAAPSVHARHAH